MFPPSPQQYSLASSQAFTAICFNVLREVNFDIQPYKTNFLALKRWGSDIIC